MHRFSNHCCSLVATFSSFSHTTKSVCMWSPTHQVFVYFWGVPALLIHGAISLPPTRPLNTNKRAMLLLVAMDHGCPDIVWCSWGMLKLSRSLCVFKASLSLSHTQRHLPFQALMQPFLISFHTHFLTKTGKVRGWREGRMHSHSSALAIHLCAAFVHDSLFMRCHFSQGLLTPIKLISLFRILSNTLNLCVYTYTNTHAPLGTLPLVHRQPIGIQDWYWISDRPLKGLKGHK